MGYFNPKIYLYVLICCISFNRQFSFANEANPKIIIIGAGAAGITAATTLVDNGFTDVTVLETKPRIGGRIHTVPFGKNVIDLGSEWVYGENPVYELASKHDLLDTETATENLSYIRSNTEVLAEIIWRRLRNITDDSTSSMSDEEIRAFKGSFGEYSKKKFDEVVALPENADLDKKVLEEYFKSYAQEISSIECTESLDIISSHGYANFEVYDGEQGTTWKDKGNVELLHLLMDTHKTRKEFGKLDGKIKLSQTVNEIQWQRDDNKALVKTQEGAEYLADHVIVTVPLGVLKANSKNMFKPNLPETKQKAIEALGFGLVNKIFLELKKPFWQPDWDGVYFLWREEELKELRGTEREWLQDIFGFGTLGYQPNVLGTLVTGKGASHIENLKEEQIKADCLYLLNKFMPKDSKEIVNIKISNWGTDSSFRGAGSYHSFETDKANADNDQLAEPVNLKNDKPILLFAGEATAPTHYATVHGAVETGQREAKRLQDYYKKN